jgi:hypothetical protein
VPSTQSSRTWTWHEIPEKSPRMAKAGRPIVGSNVSPARQPCRLSNRRGCCTSSQNSGVPWQNLLARALNRSWLIGRIFPSTLAFSPPVLDGYADIRFQFTETCQISLQAIRIATTFEATHERVGRPEKD